MIADDVPGAEGLRVYEADAVDAHIHSLEATITELRTELEATQARLTEATAQASVLHDVEAMVGRTMLMAQRAADEALLEATREAVEIRTSAEREAEAILVQARRAADATTDRQRFTHADPAPRAVRAVVAHFSSEPQATKIGSGPWADPEARWRIFDPESDTFFADLHESVGNGQSLDSADKFPPIPPKPHDLTDIPPARTPTLVPAIVRAKRARTPISTGDAGTGAAVDDVAARHDTTLAAGSREQQGSRHWASVARMTLGLLVSLSREKHRTPTTSGGRKPPSPSRRRAT